MKKILLILFTVAIFVIGGIFGYKKILSIEKENKIIQLFNKDSLENFSKNKNEMLEKLKTLNKEEADELYEQYLESNNTILENLNIEHDKLLSGGIYNNEDTSENFTDEEWKIANKFLNKYDLELWYLARGTCIIKEVPDFYYKTFKDYVTDDYKEYLKITSKENEEHYVADSGLCITLEELGDRIVTWENFLEKYPNSKLNDKVNNICNSYRRDYILGVPGGIYDYKESAEEYNRFIKKYPDSPTTELLGYYLEEVNLDKPEDNDSEALSKMIDEYIETADPVSSAGLISKYPLNISSATVRNEMLELEKMGYLEKPYSSSGRVPSKLGYRYYVDKLILDEKLSSEDLKLIRKNLGQKVINLEELTKITTATISEITHYTSIAITSKDIKEIITAVEFIRIGLDTIMVLIITDRGLVKETIIKFDKELSDNILTDLRKLFAKRIIGKPLEIIPKSIVE